MGFFEGIGDFIKNPVGGLIGAGLNFTGSFFGNRYAADRSFAQTQANNLAMWNLANQYNTPKAQMQRFREAGLNPHLIYGQANAASPVSTASYGMNPPGGLAFDREALMNLQAQNDLLKAQADSVRDSNTREEAMQSLRQDLMKVQTDEAKWRSLKEQVGSMVEKIRYGIEHGNYSYLTKNGITEKEYDIIKAGMLSGNTLTQLAAVAYFGVCSLSARNEIKERLKSMGIDMEKYMKDKKGLGALIDSSYPSPDEVNSWSIKE